VEESSLRSKSAGSTSRWGWRRRGASGGGGDRWWATLEHGEVKKKVARGAVRRSGARDAFYRPARRTEGAGGSGSSVVVEIQWSHRFHGVKRGGESMGHWVREGEGKAAGWRFDSATHARGRTADGGVWRSGRSNGRWWHDIRKKEKVPRVGWLGPKWAESWAGYEKSQEKWNGLQKLFRPKTNWAPTAEFWI
jgi:hypothetical protein